MKTGQGKLTHMPDPVDLQGIEACKETIMEIISYSLHPNAHTFKLDDRTNLINIYHILDQLMVQLRTKHGSCDGSTIIS
ncbi:MAG: hypothetical protein EOO89_30595 [Pedobacter sp.]|nr:MAG: hypothetical protein EOO89_30595 [Pedobacter sp.]